jgi:RHS repeat-associated protein
MSPAGRWSQPTNSRVYHHAYGTVHEGNPAHLNTDRTFTGQKQDGTGLLYYNARYYDPTLGTFISPDTLVPDAGVLFDYNRYLYVRGNPLKYTDPTGHCAQTIGDEDFECWYYLQKLVYGEHTKDLFTWEESSNWSTDEIKMLLELCSSGACRGPDAFLLGGGGFFIFDTPFGFEMSGRFGLEYVYNGESKEHDLFFVYGGALEFSIRKLAEVATDPRGLLSGKPIVKVAGPSGNVYLGQINNLKENGDYEGPARATDTVAGWGPYTFFKSDFHTPGAESGPNGTTVGWAPSIGPNLGTSAVRVEAVRLRNVWNLVTDLVTGD